MHWPSFLCFGGYKTGYVGRYLKILLSKTLIQPIRGVSDLNMVITTKFGIKRYGIIANCRFPLIVFATIISNLMLVVSSIKVKKSKVQLILSKVIIISPRSNHLMSYIEVLSLRWHTYIFKKVYVVFGAVWNVSFIHRGRLRSATNFNMNCVLILHTYSSEASSILTPLT